MSRRSPPAVGAVSLLLAVLIHASMAAAAPVTATDFRGQDVSLEQPAQRIVCLLESALSGLYMLGAEAQVVGVSTNIYQESVFQYYAAMDPRIRDRTLATPGNWDFVNIESVVALEPDLVVVWAGQEESIRALEEKGIPVFGVFIAEFADIHREITALGTLTGKQERAEHLTTWAQAELDSVRQRVADAELEQTPRVYFMWAQGALETAGRKSTVNELIKLAGGLNVAAGSELEHLVVNLENVLVWNPEIVLMWCNDRMNPADVGQLAGWRSLAAVEQQRVFEFPDPFSCDFWTLKYLFTVRLAARWCHPSQFSHTDLAALRAGFFAELYGSKLPADAAIPLLPSEHGTE
jgi:iron complex transport system substrate-binding protein